MRLCSGAGCGRAIPEDARYCDACRSERALKSQDGIRSNVAVRYDGAYDEKLDRLRKGTRWQKTRARVAKRDPMCKRCDVRITRIVDHKIPAAVAIQQAQESGRWLYDPNAGYYIGENLQGLCFDCHAIKTAEDKAHIGAWPSVLELYDQRKKKVYSF
jgi:5-methylcytosine-specific restriction endonuclease McrA